ISRQKVKMPLVGNLRRLCNHCSVSICQSVSACRGIFPRSGERIRQNRAELQWLAGLTCVRNCSGATCRTQLAEKETFQGGSRWQPEAHYRHGSTNQSFLFAALAGLAWRRKKNCPTRALTTAPCILANAAKTTFSKAWCCAS